MDQYYKAVLAEVEAVLVKSLPGKDLENWAEEIAGEPTPDINSGAYGEINAPALELLSRGGKRWRPVLMCLSCELYGGGKAALPLIPLVEFPHNGSLIVDDIEDHSDMRRGKPAVHMLYGEDASINTGNLLYFLPLSLLENFQLDEALRLRLYGYYGQAMRRLHLGQGLDIQWHRSKDYFPPRQAYTRMCRFKTGALSRLAGQAGAAAAGRGEEEAGFLGGLWEDLGLAFQILDDITNLKTGNPGKKRGDDIVEGKKSLPVIYAVESVPANKLILPEIFQKARDLGFERGRAEIDRAISLIEASGALERAREDAIEILERVASAVKTNFSASPARAAVLEMVSSFLG